MDRPDSSYENDLLQSGYTNIVGVDEVGRGALAGPLVVGACRWVPDVLDDLGVADSKQLSASRRAKIFHAIQERSNDWATGEALPSECDHLGMGQALALAAVRAIMSLPEMPDAILLDGPHDFISPKLPEGLDIVVRTVPGGDKRCVSVAAASIVAKVTRDTFMEAISGIYQGYGFARNKGYGTPDHMDALRSIGPSSVHRMSWKPIRDIASQSR